MTTFKVTKLDRRHSGKMFFKYFITPVNTSWLHTKKWEAEREFLKWQDWCWTTYGQGTERDWTHHIKDTAHWGWETHHSNNPRLYLKGDEELMLFKLRWA